MGRNENSSAHGRTCKRAVSIRPLSYGRVLALQAAIRKGRTMERLDLRIEGITAGAGATLRLSPSGFKHSAVLFLAASPLLPSPYRIDNIPQISDVTGMVRCLEHLGCTTKTENSVLTIDNAGLIGHQIPPLLTE